MPEAGQWGKFRRAVDDVRLSAQRVPANGFIAAALEAAQYFYLPEAYNPVEGKLLDADLQQIFHLPFPITAVLSECDFYEDARTSTGYIETADSISIGVEPEYWRKFAPARLDPFQQPGVTGGWALMSASYSNEVKRWVAMPYIGIVRYHADRPGCEICLKSMPQSALGMMPMLNAEQQDVVLRDYGRDLNRLQNLCLMLSCHNVQKHRVTAPVAMNKNRTRKNRAPWPDYHVLKVDGVLWDRNPSKNTGGPGYRSHFRRGHRREFKPGHFTWVTQTLVHGKAPGFVDKEYDMTPAKEPTGST